MRYAYTKILIVTCYLLLQGVDAVVFCLFLILVYSFGCYYTAFVDIILERLSVPRKSLHNPDFVDIILCLISPFNEKKKIAMMIII